MPFGGFPFVERIDLYASCGGNILDGVAFHVYSGSENVLGFRECIIVFHLLTSMG
jgi:hypothetical protein